MQPPILHTIGMNASLISITFKFFLCTCSTPTINPQCKNITKISLGRGFCPLVLPSHLYTSFFHLGNTFSLQLYLLNYSSFPMLCFAFFLRCYLHIHRLCIYSLFSRFYFLYHFLSPSSAFWEGFQSFLHHQFNFLQGELSI